MIVTTLSDSPPATRPPVGTRWACWGYRPRTGLPKDAGGQLIREWLWKAIGKEPPARQQAKPEPAPSPRQRRTGVQIELPGDLFGI